MKQRREDAHLAILELKSNCCTIITGHHHPHVRVFISGSIGFDDLNVHSQITLIEKMVVVLTWAFTKRRTGRTILFASSHHCNVTVVYGCFSAINFMYVTTAFSPAEPIQEASSIVKHHLTEWMTPTLEP